MSSITESTPTHIVKSDRTGRTRYTRQYKQEVLAAFESSSLSAPGPTIIEPQRGSELRGKEDGRTTNRTNRTNLFSHCSDRTYAFYLSISNLGSLESQRDSASQPRVGRMP